MEPTHRCPECQDYYFVDTMGKGTSPTCPNCGVKMLTYEEWQARKEIEGQ